MGAPREPLGCTFPYFFVGTFIEARVVVLFDEDFFISLLFRRDFH